MEACKLNSVPINSTEIPYLDVTDKAARRKVLQGYGATDASDIVVRNLERLFIQKEAPLISIASKVFNMQKTNGLRVLINQAPAGGVNVQYPVDNSNLGDTRSDNLPDMKGLYLDLDRANVTYSISNEAIFEGGNLAQQDSVQEATEQLAANIDKVIIDDLKAKKFAANSFTATNKWTTTGTPYDDIRKATNKIIQNSAINVLAVEGNPKFFSCIVPIALREVFQKREIVDGVKTSLGGQIEANLNTQIVYSRSPFTGLKIDLLTEAIIIPNFDRKVGRLYTFDGSNTFPSLFQTVNENGKRISQNSWWKVGISLNEKTALAADNRRIGVIDTIA